MIKATDLLKKYPDPSNLGCMFNAVDGINLNISEGIIFGLLGPNGAGKTTTLEMLEGLNDIDHGEVIIDQMNIKDHPYEIKKIIGVQLQSNEYFDRLNLKELITLFGSLYSKTIDAELLLAKVRLDDKAKALPDDLSGGQKQRFSIACALVNNPKVLFLDEPTTGLDPQAKRNLWDLVIDLNNEGMTIVLTTHNMEEAQYLCQEIAIMDKGKIIAQDSPENLISKFANKLTTSSDSGTLEDVFLNLTGYELRD